MTFKYIYVSIFSYWRGYVMISFLLKMLGDPNEKKVKKILKNCLFYKFYIAISYIYSC